MVIARVVDATMITNEIERGSRVGDYRKTKKVGDYLFFVIFFLLLP